MIPLIQFSISSIFGEFFERVKQTACNELQHLYLSSIFTWHDDLVAGDTFGGEFVTVTVIAEQRLILAGEWLICQWAVAAETAEAVLVIMPVFIEELLAER